VKLLYWVIGRNSSAEHFEIKIVGMGAREKEVREVDIRAWDVD